MASPKNTHQKVTPRMGCETTKTAGDISVYTGTQRIINKNTSDKFVREVQILSKPV